MSDERKKERRIKKKGKRLGLRRSAIRDSENEKNEEKDETLGACTYVDRHVCCLFPCGLMCADACRARRQECAKKRSASDKM